jgi:hypothetical protein
MNEGMDNNESKDLARVNIIPEVQNNNFNATLAAFEELKKLAEYLAKSDTFSKEFITKDKLLNKYTCCNKSFFTKCTYIKWTSLLQWVFVCFK